MKDFNEKDWIYFRALHPELRYFQALRAYMEVDFILVADFDKDAPDIAKPYTNLKDTFYIGDNS